MGLFLMHVFLTATNCLSWVHRTFTMSFSLLVLLRETFRDGFHTRSKEIPLGFNCTEEHVYDRFRLDGDFCWYLTIEM